MCAHLTPTFALFLQQKNQKESGVCYFLSQIFKKYRYFACYRWHQVSISGSGFASSIITVYILGVLLTSAVSYLLLDLQPRLFHRERFCYLIFIYRSEIFIGRAYDRGYQLPLLSCFLRHSGRFSCYCLRIMPNNPHRLHIAPRFYLTRIRFCNRKKIKRILFLPHPRQLVKLLGRSCLS